MTMDSVKADNAALRKELFRKEQNYKTDLAAKDEEIKTLRQDNVQLASKNASKPTITL